MPVEFVAPDDDKSTIDKDGILECPYCSETGDMNSFWFGESNYKIISCKTCGHKFKVIKSVITTYYGCPVQLNIE